MQPPKSEIKKEHTQMQRRVRLAKTIFKPVLGKVRFQRIFEILYGLSLIGMNYGTGDDSSYSGETFLLNYFQENSKTRNPIIFDVGANVGKYVEYVLKIINNPTVFCFEPSKNTFELLHKNIGQNKNVILNNFGFGKENKKTILFSNENASVLASLYNRQLDHLGITMNKKEEVEIKKLDDYCDQNDIQNIDLLKLDVEGNELDVLYGAERMLSTSSIRFIQFEFGGCNIDSRTYFRDFFYLLNPNFNIYRVLQNGIYPIKKYGEMNEIFFTANFLAIKNWDK